MRNNSSERCGECAECGHSKGVDPRGRCLEAQRDPGGSMVYCGHKCVYPATGAGDGEQCVNRPEHDWYNDGDILRCYECTATQSARPAPELFERWWSNEGDKNWSVKHAARKAWYACAESLGVYEDPLKDGDSNERAGG